MGNKNLTIVYHPMCKASTDFIIKVSEIQGYDKEFINLKEDKIESSQIDVDVVPLLIIDDDPNKVYRGKKAFEIIETLQNEVALPNNKKPSSMKYGVNVVFSEQKDDKKERIDLDKR
tara:strand:+ start:8201 stop:8551 length:351 start_codon:yes stop_codon:yes gene_type:complete